MRFTPGTIGSDTVSLGRGDPECRENSETVKTARTAGDRTERAKENDMTLEL